MKKLFILAVLFAIGMMATAQTTVYSQKGQTYWKGTTDITITDATPVTIIINADQAIAEPTTQHALIDVDSVSGNHTAVAVLLYGQNFDSQAWTAISSTIVDQGVNQNTDLTITNTTETRWRRFKMVFTGTGTGVSKIDTWEFKVYNPD